MKNKDNFTVKNTWDWAYFTGFAVILALPLLTFFPWFFPADFGKTIVLRTILTLLLLLFTWQFFYQRNQLQLPSLRKNGAFWLLSALFGTFVIATIFSVDPYFSLWGSPSRAGGLINFGFYIVLAILAFLTVKKEDWQKVWDFSFIIGLLVSAVGVIQFFQSPDRPSSTTGNPIFLAMYLSFLFFMALIFAIQENNKTKRIFYVTALAVFSGVILLTVTRAVFLGILLGGLYFLLFYNKKFLKIKVAGSILILVFIAGFLYLNANHVLPTFLERVSIENFLKDNRFEAWGIATNAFKAKPIFGWGPENFNIAFDRFYNPKDVPFTGGSFDWWDRAHNIILDIGIQAGILGLIAYFSLFGFLLFKLQRAKKYLPEKKLTLHGIQSALIAYMIANFFGFDAFVTYFMYFLIIGYSLQVIYGQEINSPIEIRQKKAFRPVIMGMLLCLAVFFLWQYNVWPTNVNANINIAGDLVDQKKCDEALKIADEALTQKSFLDSYLRLQYVGFLQTCAKSYPQNDLAYAKRGVEIMSEAVTIQPMYSRYWLFLASFTNVIASQEKDPLVKEALIKQGYEYFDHANVIAPNHQETLIERAKLDLTAGDYQAMQEDANVCITLNPDLGDCWWQLALSQIYLKDVVSAKTNIQKATEKGFDTTSLAPSNQLLNAYTSIKNLQELILVYQRLIGIFPNDPQYHASLAFAYRQVGEYMKARYEVSRFLILVPDRKAEAEAFLKTLPPVK